LRGGYTIDGTGADLFENKDIIIYQGKIKSIIPQGTNKLSKILKVIVR
tara:strand:- start:125 stop:268 length:144 start_codon:yes stop_codon:yes gene_type:complete